MTPSDPLHPGGTLPQRVADQARAREQFLAAVERLVSVEAQALDDADQAQTSWSDCRTRLVMGLIDCLDLADPLDPADAAILRDRPAYPARPVVADIERLTRQIGHHR